MESSTAKQLALILLVALALRLAGGWVWQARLDGRFGFGDSESYWTLGRSIARGQSYRCGDARIFRTPGYPVLLAPLFLVSGGEPHTFRWEYENYSTGEAGENAAWVDNVTFK